MSKNEKSEGRNDLIRNVQHGQDGYDVPEGYFDALPEMVMARIKEDQALQSSTGARIRQLVMRPSIAYAAMITGLLIAAIMFLDRPGQIDAFAGITNDEAYAYVYNNIYEYTVNDIVTIADNSIIDEEIIGLTDEQINFALDELMRDVDPEELDDLF